MKNALYYLFIFLIFVSCERTHKETIIAMHEDKKVMNATTNHILVKQITINEVIQAEKKIGAVLHKDEMDITISLGKQLYPLDYNLANPITFHRKKSEFHPIPAVSYFYDKKQKLVRYVDYRWDLTNEVDVLDFNTYSKRQIKESKRVKEFYTHYMELCDEIISKIGKQSKSTGPLKQVKDKSDSYLSRVDTWDTNTVFIELELHFSNSTEDIEFGIYNITTRLYWKK
jgi:hypothetical protein